MNIVANATDEKSTMMTRLAAYRRNFIYTNGERLTRALTRFFASQSLVEDAPILDSKHFPFLQEFTNNWEVIQKEVLGILKNREEIPAFQEVSPEQHWIAKGKNWRTFFLFGFGEKLPANCAKAPVTTALLEKVPNLQISWFSILSPGYHIPPHRGVTKGILRAHLGLIIPKDAEKCRIRVGDQIRVWHPGEIFVLDDTYEHEVWNDTSDERVILIFDFDRPMKWLGRNLLHSFIYAMKFTAFYQEPRKNMMTFEQRFEAATKRNNENLEKLADAREAARKK